MIAWIEIPKPAYYLLLASGFADVEPKIAGDIEASSTIKGDVIEVALPEHMWHKVFDYVEAEVTCSSDTQRDALVIFKRRLSYVCENN